MSPSMHPVQGSQAMLRDMLQAIVAGMATSGVSSWVLKQAARKLQTPGYTISGQDISMIFDKLDVPLLVLIGRHLSFLFCSFTIVLTGSSRLTLSNVCLVDEVQRLLLPVNPSTGFIDKGAQNSFGLLLKELLCKSSTKCEVSVPRPG